MEENEVPDVIIKEYKTIETDVSLEEFFRAVEDKIEQMGGLVDEEKAAELIAHEHKSADPRPDLIPSCESVPVSYHALTDEESIARGGNADVHKATFSLSQAEVTLAIKEPRMSGTLHGDQVERMLREAETWDKLDDHDYIVEVVDYDSDPLPWIAMEYMDGGHLGERSGEMALPQAFWTATAVTKGVYHAHRKGVAHLDLKPANILFRSVDDGWDVPKVADWGLSKHLLDHSHSVEGLTPQYAAPEQFDDEYGDTDDITDIYQLGAVFYELFTGQPPFEGEPAKTMHKVLNQDPTPPSEIVDAPDQLDEILLQSLAKQKNERYENVLYLRDDLKALFDSVTDLNWKASFDDSIDGNDTGGDDSDGSINNTGTGDHNTDNASKTDEQTNPGSDNRQFPGAPEASKTGRNVHKKLESSSTSSKSLDKPKVDPRATVPDESETTRSGRENVASKSGSNDEFDCANINVEMVAKMNSEINSIYRKYNKSITNWIADNIDLSSINCKKSIFLLINIGKNNVSEFDPEKLKFKLCKYSGDEFEYPTAVPSVVSSINASEGKTGYRLCVLDDVLDDDTDTKESPDRVISEREAKVLQLSHNNNDLEYSEIADKLGCRVTSVRDILNSTPNSHEVIVRHAENMSEPSIDDIAEKSGYPPSHIEDIFNDYQSHINNSQDKTNNISLSSADNVDIAMITYDGKPCFPLQYIT